MKTQRIKIYGVIDARGCWAARSWGGEEIQASDDEAHEYELAADMMPDDSDQSTWRKFTIEASVPIPEERATVIEGRVTQ